MELSPLYRLSPELRNQIYEHVFASRYAVMLQHNSCQHALTKTCRQIRRETLAMFYSLTSFNAHLDDGPATPLTRWIKVIGPETVCGIERINVWDLHMLQFTIHGLSATRRIFSTGAIDHKWYRIHGTSSGEDELGDLGPRNDQATKDRTTYVLRPIHIRFASRELKDVFLTLHSMGLGLAQFHIVKPNNSSSNETETEDTPRVIERLTSEYAIVPLIPFTIPSTIDATMPITANPWSSSPAPADLEASPTSISPQLPPTEEEEDIYSRTNTIPNQLLLAIDASTHLQTQLSLGETTITLREQRRVIILEFEFVEDSATTNDYTLEEHATLREPTTRRAILRDFRQATLSGASHDMLHSVVGAMRNWRAMP
ncbi:hypothetical protein CKM354_000284700 [Cercospora kikuchii]|uniref:F-box domain-containing protein n=1 Tax=Cercospora kikuchii TaxID=84275 RepID=A0A9P3FEF2_9PEZI|nr:uncharacterized protein CKM354_000284700 [Cercospora kikuchii]GIZ39465.1 hypothetical protein CKM354_000284700 [Cercospora kikuchii]